MSTKNVINDKQVIATELTDNKVLHKKKPGRKKKKIGVRPNRTDIFIHLTNYVLLEKYKGLI